MCGLSAIVSPRENALQATILSMMSVMSHRGPDGEGVYADKVCETSFLALGHNRLSIIDLTDQAAQPMKTRDGRFVLIYNGEVYNYMEIAKELDATELPRGSFGDTAVVLAALVKWGPQALSKFNGMWALILYDTQEKRLLISRDRFGIKPLYYYRDGSQLFLASEIKAILVGSQARFSINANIAIPYLTRGLLNCSEDTFFTGIREFPPASYQVIDLRKGCQVLPPTQRFWLHPFENGEQPQIGAVSPEQLRFLFLDSIALRLRSDVPVGVLLSGGLDSSSIVGGIARAGALENVTMFSMIVNDPMVSEEAFIDLMAQWGRVDTHKLNISNNPFALLDRVSDGCWFNDEPAWGISDLAHMQLMELARSQGIKVILSGQGADEQLGGYNKFFYFWILILLKNGHIVDAAKTLLQFALHSNKLYEFRADEAIRYVGKSWLASRTFIPPAHLHHDGIDIGFKESYIEREWIDLTKTSLPVLLHYEDRMSMSQSVEVRVPFLDYRLVESLSRVHPSEKFDGGWTKSIFRKAIDGLVPRQIQYRRDKKGFAVPEDEWMRGVFKPRVKALFESEMRADAQGYIDARRLRRLYSSFTAGHGLLNGRHFFRAFAFETFLRRFARYIA